VGGIVIELCLCFSLVARDVLSMLTGLAQSVVAALVSLSSSVSSRACTWRRTVSSISRLSRSPTTV